MQVEYLGKYSVEALMFRFLDPLDSEQVREMARVVEEAIDGDYKPLRLLLDLSEVQNFEPSAFLSPKGAIVSAISIGPIDRYGVIGAPTIASKAVEFFGSILPLEAHSFSEEEREIAIDWLLR